MSGKEDARVRGFSYGDLEVWKLSMRLVRLVYVETAKLPAEERFGLAPQMRRASVRIPSCIAEGWGRGPGKDFLRFLRIARGSAYELSTQMLVCLDLGYAANWKECLELTDRVRKAIHGLLRSLGGR